MARRTFATLLMALLIALAASDTHARPIEVTIDGCTMLARAIYSEVSSSALYGPANAGPWLIDQGRGDIVVCEHVAKTVSQAFTSAMLSAGIDVSWRRDRMNGRPGRGHYCLSAFLSQCYPDRYPPTGMASSASITVVQKTWEIVAKAVMREMYNPISSDEVRFRSNDLKLRLGLSLRSIKGTDDR
jgi:hypothetical protein